MREEESSAKLSQLQTVELVNGRKILKKHVATIHCSNKLTLIERKIANALLYNAFKELKSETEHSISISELSRLLGFKSNNTKHLKDALKNLISTVLEWNLTGDGDGKETWSASSMLASVVFEKGVCYYQYSDRLKDLLSDPTLYGKVNLLIQSRFRSAYGLALYENCVRYRGLPNTRYFEMSLFRELMGVKDDQYPQMKDFKRRVLEPAIEEVNLHSDISITPVFRKRGRSIVAVMFQIREREQKRRLSLLSNKLENDLSQPNLIKVLVEKFFIEVSRAVTLIEKYGEEKVQSAVEYIIEGKAYKSNKIENLSGYLTATLKQGYSSESNDITRRKAKQVEENDIRRLEKEQEKNARQKQQVVEKEYIENKLLCVNEALGLLDVNARNRVVNLVLSELEKVPMVWKDEILLIKESALATERTTAYFYKHLSSEHGFNFPTFEEYFEKI